MLQKRLAILLIPILFLGCSKKQNDLTIAAGDPSISYFDAAKTIKELSEKEDEFSIGIKEEHQTREGKKITLNAFTNCYLLADGQVDLAIAQNDVTLQDDDVTKSLRNKLHLKTVLPLYPEVFMVFHKKENRATNLHELLRERRVALGPRESGTAALSRRIFSHFGIETSSYQPVYTNFEDCLLTDSIDVVCLVTSVDNPRIREILNSGGVLFQLEKESVLPGGAPLEGFAHWYPYVHSFVIPKYFYGKTPDVPIKTLAVDAVLLCREDMPESAVYDLVSTIHSNSFLRDKKNGMPLFLSSFEKMDHLQLQFPLHRGTIRYLNRNKPTFFERYAGLINLLIYLSIATASGLVALRRWQIHTRKERIDTFYLEALDIKKEVEKEENLTKMHSLKQQLVKLEERAYKLLTNEKLNADESFSILTSLISDIEKHLREKLE